MTEEASVDSLYVCFFGIREPLVQTQVLPYLRELRAGGYRILLLTFEPVARSWRGGEREAIRSALQRDGIEWVTMPWHRSALPKLVGIARAVFAVRRLARTRHARLLHARALVAGVIAACARLGSRARLLYDIRGFVADEYVEGGNWKRGGLLYRIATRADRWLLRSADGFVVLTERAREHLFGATRDGRDDRGRPVEVIPTCTDPESFAEAAASRDEVRASLGFETSARVYVYVGSIGTWYRSDDLADFFAFACAHDPHAQVLCLTPSDARAALQRFHDHGVPRERVLVLGVAPSEVPRYLSAADVGVSFSEAGFARMAASPTKVGEYLAAGLPVIHSAGVGDVDALLEANGVGIVVSEYDGSAYGQALQTMDELMADPSLPERCRAVARAQLDLRTVGGTRYRRIYARLLGENGGRA